MATLHQQLTAKSPYELRVNLGKGGPKYDVRSALDPA
jgi:hypothetical protein